MRGIRILKILLVLAVGLQAGFYAISNLVNIDGAFAAVAYVLSMADQAIYDEPVLPPFTAPVLVGLALALIIAAESAIGVLCIAGAAKMWNARAGGVAEFARARTVAVFGCGLALLLWVGLFMAFGGALYQMWQTEIGLASLEGAFMYAVSSAVVLLFVNQPEADPRS